MQRPALVIAALALLVPAAPAVAGDHSWKVGNDSYNVHLNDLDLQSPAGRAQALARIEGAAVAVCKTAGVQSQRDACVARTIAAAAAKPAGQPIRTALAERAAPAMQLAESR